MPKAPSQTFECRSCGKRRDHIGACECGETVYRTVRQQGIRTKRKTAKEKTAQQLRSEDAQEVYRVLAAMYRKQNPACAYCGKTLPPITVDHIVSGVAGKSISRINIDTWNPACIACNTEHLPIEEKVLAKLLTVVRTIERLRRQQLSSEQYRFIVEGMINAS